MKKVIHSYFRKSSLTFQFPIFYSGCFVSYSCKGKCPPLLLHLPLAHFSLPHPSLPSPIPTSPSCPWYSHTCSSYLCETAFLNVNSRPMFPASLDACLGLQPTLADETVQNWTYYRPYSSSFCATSFYPISPMLDPWTLLLTLVSSLFRHSPM